MGLVRKSSLRIRLGGETQVEDCNRQRCPTATTTRRTTTTRRRTTTRRTTTRRTTTTRTTTTRRTTGLFKLISKSFFKVIN